MCLPRIFDNLSFLPANFSRQGSNKKNTAKNIDGPVNQINGNNNVVSSNISIHTDTSTQANKEECFRLLKISSEWMGIHNEDGYEFMSKVNNAVSVIFHHQHSVTDYKDFISSCWADNSGTWCDVNICINNKSIYSNQYCTFDGCHGSTIVRPDFEWILKPNGHDNIRLFFYIDDSEEIIINNFIESQSNTFPTARRHKINRYIATFRNISERDRFFLYVKNNEDEIIEKIRTSDVSLSAYSCQNILDKRNEIDLQSAIVLTDTLRKWRSGS